MAVGSAPDAWKAGKRPYGTGLNLGTAKKMLEAAEKEAARQGVPMVVAIVDSGGHLLAFRRMDNAILAGINIAMDKAYTAVFGKIQTWHWTHAIKAAGFAPLFFHERWIDFPGGFPIVKDGVLVGGIGVSGGIFEDVTVARAALEAGGFSVEEVDAVIAQAKEGERD